MAQRYRMTARRRAALKKAQAASARKRARGKKIKRGAAIVGGAAAIGGLAYARHNLSGSRIGKIHETNILNSRDELTGGKKKGRGFHTTRLTMRNPQGATHKARNRVKERTFGYQKSSRGPLGTKTTIGYQHKKLTAEVLGGKIKQTAPGRQLAYKTRALRKAANPFAPAYQPYHAGQYGAAYGKQLQRLDQFTRRVGGRKVKTKDMFGWIA